MSYTNPWAHIVALKREAEDLRRQVSDRGWSLAEPEDIFFVAFRRGRKYWGERPRRLRAKKASELLAEIDKLEAEFAAAQKA